MRRDSSLYLQDILQCIERIQKSTKKLTLNEFKRDIDIQDAVVRRIEISGEAVRQIPTEFKEKTPRSPLEKNCWHA